jgi:hypothetical protein
VGTTGTGGDGVAIRRVLAISSAATLLVLAGCSGASSGPTDRVSPSGAGPDAKRQSNVATATQVQADRDAFGIRNVYRTRPGGTLWTSKWDEDRDFDGVDPRDPWFDADHGSATYRVESGKLAVSGEIPRMYVYDPERRRQWRDVETTMYFKRVDDTGIPYAGMTIVARSNHLDTESGRFACDTRGYGARMRYDGHIDFEKETDYPYNAAVANKPYWPDELPRDRWVGVKFVVYDDAQNRVHLELWVDRTGGRAGGRWTKANQVVDDGNLFGDRACRRGIDPQAALLNDPSRKGSESGRPNLTVFFRSDGVGTNGLLYKWGSAREIAAPISTSPGSAP